MLKRIVDFHSQSYLRYLDWKKQQPIQSTVDQLVTQQYWPEDKLEELQIQKLQELILHATKFSSYYQEKFSEFGLDPKRINSIRDICRIPPISKQELFDRYDDLKTSQPLGRINYGSTSGSTGVAIRFQQDSMHSNYGFASVWRGRTWWGVKRNVRQVNLWGRPVEGTMKTNLSTRLKYRLRNIIHVNTFQDYNERTLERIVKVIKQFRPALIYGYGSSLGILARYMSDKQIYFSIDERPKIVEFTADHMLDEEIEMMARHTGAPVLSQYGASEVPGIAQQCWAGNSHISIDSNIVEFLRPDGSTASPGELAEIVVTPLFEYAMPLIRYRVEDMGAYIIGQCKCGLSLPMMELRVGKVVDLISTSTHARVSAHVLDYINIYLMRNNLSGVRQFLVEQHDVDSFLLIVSKSPKFDPQSVETFISRMKTYLGGQIQVSVSYVQNIPRSASGKRRYFLNKQSRS